MPEPFVFPLSVWAARGPHSRAGFLEIIPDKYS